jgi:hypothetical protein
MDWIRVPKKKDAKPSREAVKGMVSDALKNKTKTSIPRGKKQKNEQ